VWHEIIFNNPKGYAKRGRLTRLDLPEKWVVLNRSWLGLEILDF
jgi:hypothetical protein